jgi:glycosyltransferase involved in cell wall biosynthesis
VSAAPELACAVLCLGGDRRVVDAIRSLRKQSVPIELVVVNSGGGEPAAALRAAGIEVRLINHPERLFPGGARNLGICATTAPYLSFLAADCRAEPGWAEGRLRAHRAGAAAVATVMTAVSLETRSACASLLLAYGRRLTSTPPRRRRFYGLSYDRALFDRYGRFREDLRSGEDSEFNARFSGEARVAWVPEVRTAHICPTGPRALIHDQFRRGRLRATAERELGGPGRTAIAGRYLRQLAFRLRLARDTTDPPVRRALLRAWPLLLPGCLAYAAGALTSPREAHATD